MLLFLKEKTISIKTRWQKGKVQKLFFGLVHWRKEGFSLKKRGNQAARTRNKVQEHRWDRNKRVGDEDGEEERGGSHIPSSLWNAACSGKVLFISFSICCKFSGVNPTTPFFDNLLYNFFSNKVFTSFESKVNFFVDSSHFKILEGILNFGFLLKLLKKQKWEQGP